MPNERDVPAAPSEQDTQGTHTVAKNPPGPDRHIGPYRILRELGHGGMGSVYLGARADEQYQKRVAIKIIKAGMDGAEVVGRFRRERQILASLDHPNIARLLDGGTTDDGLPFLVLEYIEGQPLHEFCDSRRLTLSERLHIFQQVCSAVAYAHRNLIVHRDLKPSNILVTVEGVPRLLDFGIAKLLNPELSGAALTGTGLAMTPEYASPEQARGQPITTASDVYSLGVILYELLTGQSPYHFQTGNPLEVLRAVVEEDPQKPSTAVERMRAQAALGPGGHGPTTAEAVSRARDGTPARLQRRLRGDLDNIVMMALRKEPQRRYPSVEALSEDIRRYLEQRPVVARRGTAAYRAGKYVRRHAVGVTVAAAGLILLVGFAGAMAVQSARVARERDVAEKERAAAQRERETAQRVSTFLVDLFKVSDPGEARGNTVTAREVLDKGAAKIATELKDKPEIRGTLLHTMGTVYLNLGLYDKAISILQDAVETKRAFLGNDHLEVARSLNNLANVFRRIGDYERAEKIHREVLAIRRRQLGNEHSDVAQSLNNLANVLYQKGDYAGAEAMHRETLALRRKLFGNESPEVGTSLDNLAMVLGSEGNYAEAEPLLRESLAMWRRLLGNENRDVGGTLLSLAIVIGEQGRFAEAEPLIREAVAMWRKVLGNAHPDVGIAVGGLAEVLCREQKAQEGERIAREGLHTLKTSLPDGHPSIAAGETTLGGCLTLEHSYAEAEQLLLHSYPILRTKTGERSTKTRDNLEKLVHLYEAWGRPDEAAKYRSQLEAASVVARR